MDIEKLLWEKMEDIVNETLNNVSTCYDGVCQLNVENWNLLYASLTTGEIENPKNRTVEVYRIEQGFDAEEVCECYLCDECTDDCRSCNEDKLDECVREVLVDDFRVNFDEILDNVYTQIQEWGYDLI